ncbi:MAG: dihydropteroate synthase [Flavobacteriaceae bacterium]
MTLNCQGTLIDLCIPKVMGILNLTPDSFYDGGQYNELEAALVQTEKMLSEGATFIDVGAVSSKPGAQILSPKEEAERLFPILKALVSHFPKALFTVDTYHSTIAEKALDMGVAFINDISAGAIDDQLLSTIARYAVPYVCMHMQGQPDTMQQQPHYDAIIEEQLLFFSEKIERLHQMGINDVIIDPGFGFGKTLDHNYELLNKLQHFHRLNAPLMVGLSRKSMIYKKLNIEPQKALNGSTVLHTIALQKGAHLLRVHDVKEAVEAIDLLQALK